MRLTFGVLLRGLLHRRSPSSALNEILAPTMGEFRGMSKFTYPVCLFFFTMREDQAFFSWLAEPRISQGTPKLVHHDAADCVELTDDLLGQVVEQIVAWYDVVEVLLIACRIPRPPRATGRAPPGGTGSASTRTTPGAGRPA